LSILTLQLEGLAMWEPMVSKTDNLSDLKRMAKNAICGIQVSLLKISKPETGFRRLKRGKS